MELEGQKLGQATDERVKDSPFDADFWFRMDPGLESPKLKLPEPKDKLYVVKAIDKYEPLIHSQPDTFKADPKKVFKPFKCKPKSHAEMRDTIAELTGQELQKIFVGPKNGIDFKTVNMKSVETRFF